MKIKRSHIVPRFALPALISSMLLTGIATADKITLKSGKTYNGSVIGKTEDSYILRVEVVEGIFEEKTVKKTDIKEIKKSDDSLAAFNKIKRAVPTPDLLSTEGYDARISAVKAFISKHPKSSKASEAKKMVETLEKEKAHIAAGGVKLRGSLITMAEIKKDKYTIEPEIMLHRMKKYTKAQNYGEALRVLAAMEADFSSTKAYREAVADALAFLPNYKTWLDTTADGVAGRIKKREDAYLSMSEKDRERTKKLFADEAEKYQEKLAHAKDVEKTRWLPTNIYFEEPLRAISRSVDTEISRLNRVAATPLKHDAGKIYRELNALLELESYKNAKSKLNDFRRAKANKDDLTKFSDRLKALDKVLRERKEAEKNKKDEPTEKDKPKENKKTEKDGGALEKLGDKTNLNKKNELLNKLNNK